MNQDELSRIIRNFDRILRTLPTSNRFFHQFNLIDFYLKQYCNNKSTYFERYTIPEKQHKQAIEDRLSKFRSN